MGFFGLVFALVMAYFIIYAVSVAFAAVLVIADAKSENDKANKKRVL